MAVVFFLPNEKILISFPINGHFGNRENVIGKCQPPPKSRRKRQERRSENAHMTVVEAQREVRTVFLNGSIGQLVSGVIWLVSAAFASWGSIRQAILAVVVGGMFIFPLTQLLLRLFRRPFTLTPENPLKHLAIQVAFLIPLTLPVVGAATLHNVNWFYPGCMVVVGAHFLPFVFLYGMWHYGVLSAILVAGGVLLGLRVPDVFSLGGWLTGVVFILFAGWVALLRVEKPDP